MVKAVLCNWKDHLWQWCVSKSLIRSFTEGKEARCGLLADLHGLSTHTMADFKLPTCHQLACKILEILMIGSWEPCQHQHTIARDLHREPQHRSAAWSSGGHVFTAQRDHDCLWEGLNLRFCEALISEYILFRSTDHV